MSSKNKKDTKCSKVKNPCKFCLQQVTNKNGLQCQGACKKWAHFKCLHYTPGKISDIKAGIIKVTCPCPDCETQQTREFLTNPPYTCSNDGCPANKLPKCESTECPKNRPGSVPGSGGQCGNTACTNAAVPCDSNDCLGSPGPKRKKMPARNSPRRTPPRNSPKREESNVTICRDQKTCLLDTKRVQMPQTISETKKSKAKKPVSPPPKMSPPPKKAIKNSPPVSSEAINCKCDKKMDSPKKASKKSSSLSILSSAAINCKKPQCSPSDSNFMRNPKNQALMVDALQEMCGTVGKLSVQLKDLMCKMMQN